MGTVEVADLRLKTPSTIMINGPTQSGKTYLTSQLLRNKSSIFNPVPEQVVWCYGMWQPAYDELKESGVVDEFMEGAESFKPKREEEADRYIPTIVVFDDLQRSANGSMAKIFEVGSHHWNVTPIFLVQNAFHQGKHSRDMRLNTHYQFVFRNNSDMSQITTIAKQAFPEKPSSFKRSMTGQRRGHTVICCSTSIRRHHLS